MICPYCSHDNVEGADTCESCSQDLTAYDEPAGSTPIEASILREPLARFEPRPPVIVSPDTPVRDAVQRICEHRIGCVLVGTPESVVGIFSERDVLLRIADRYEERASQPVSEFMTHDPECLSADTPIAYALNRMSLGDFRHLPIEQDGTIVGMVSLRDVVGFLSTWCPDLIPPRQVTA